MVKARRNLISVLMLNQPGKSVTTALARQDIGEYSTRKKERLAGK